MEDKLFKNDLIFAEKITVGPRIPNSLNELPWISKIFRSEKKIEFDLDRKRLPGLKRIKKGDILVFEQSAGELTIKRCVALPGEKLHLSNGIVFTDEIELPLIRTVKNRYQIFTSNEKNFKKEVRLAGLQFSNFKRIRTNKFIGNISDYNYKVVKAFSSVLDLSLKKEDTESKHNIFSNPINMYYDINNMGPLIVPQKGNRIQFNDFNYEIYHKVLWDFEGVEIYKNEKKNIFENSEGDEIFEHTFKNDYYFFLGDNRANSIDSRTFGFVPKRLFVSKYIFSM